MNTVSSESSLDSSSMSQSVPTLNAHQIIRRQTPSSLVLLPGKWRKSLHIWYRTNHNEISGRTSPKQCLKPRDVKSDDLRVVRRNSRKSQHINGISESYLQINYEKEVLKYCGQSKPLKFSATYAAAKMLNTCKIGEGVYGEVFKYTPKNKTESSVVLKVLPIEGSSLVNEEAQKTFEQILPEIIISREMSRLRTNQTTSTSGFVDLYNVTLSTDTI